MNRRIGAAKAALPAYLRVNGNRKQDFRDCGKPNPLNPPCQGDLSLNSPLSGGLGGLGTTNIGFLQSLGSRNDGCWFLHSLIRDCARNLDRHALHVEHPTLNPLNPPYQGDFLLNSPLIRGARGVKNDERWVSCTVS